MHQTISGETLKKTSVTKINLDSFLSENKIFFNNLKNKNIFYDHDSFIDKVGENYFYANNLTSSEQRHFKAILKKEYIECEKLYPFLGQIFLEYIFNSKIKFSKTTFVLDEVKIKKIINLEKNNTIKSIFKNYIENCSLEYNVLIENNFLDEIHVEKSNNIIIKKDFDKDFYSLHKKNEFVDYNVCIIDGYIDSIGEIHHLLQKSNDSKKETYVVFCYGMSNDVKKTIIVNNQRKNTRVFPISLQLVEENLNIYNDMSIIHQCEIISASKGQTVSQAVRNKLSKGKKIIINPGNSTLIIEPVCEDRDIKMHIDFLNKKFISHTLYDRNRELILDRIKSLNSKNYKLYLPKRLLSNNKFMTKIDYYFKLLSTLNLRHKKINLGNQQNIFIPKKYCMYAKEKAISVKKIFNQVEVVIEESK